LADVLYFRGHLRLGSPCICVHTLSFTAPSSYHLSFCSIQKVHYPRTTDQICNCNGQLHFRCHYSDKVFLGMSL